MQVVFDWSIVSLFDGYRLSCAVEQILKFPTAMKLEGIFCKISLLKREKTVDLENVVVIQISFYFSIAEFVFEGNSMILHSHQEQLPLCGP